MDFKPIPAEQITLVDSATGTSLAALGGKTFGPFDVRAFASFYMNLTVNVGGAPSGYDLVNVIFTWLPGLAGIATYVDAYQMFANGGAPFQFPIDGGSSNAFFQDVNHGPYLSVRFENTSTTDTMSLNYNLYGSTRVVPTPYVRQSQFQVGSLDNFGGLDGILIEGNRNLVGGTLNVPCVLGYGRVMMHIRNGGAAVVPSFTFGNATPNTVTFPSMAAGAILEQEFVFPKRSCMATFTGTGTNSFHLTIFRQFDVQ